MHCAIDVGHGYTKALSESGDRVMCPSWIVSAPEGPNLGSVAATPVTVVNGQPYLIGESARLHSVSLFSHDKATDPLTQALTWASAARLLSPGYHGVRLGVGLPLAWYAAQKSLLAESLQGPVTVGDRHLQIDQVTVFPQGIGALLTADLPENGLVGLVDIGYRTVDYLVAPIRDGVPAPMINRSGTWTGGMHHAYTSLAQQLERQFQVHFEPHELVDRHSVTVHGQPVDLLPLQDAAFSELAGDLIRHLATIWDDLQAKLDGVFLAGGGALALQSYLSSLGPIQVLADAQWANVRGYLDLLRDATP